MTGRSSSASTLGIVALSVVTHDVAFVIVYGVTAVAVVVYTAVVFAVRRRRPRRDER